jgi:hypothetical protein
MKTKDDRKFVSLKRNKRQILRTLIKDVNITNENIERGKVVIQEGRNYIIESADKY